MVVFNGIRKRKHRHLCGLRPIQTKPDTGLVKPSKIIFTEA